MSSALSPDGRYLLVLNGGYRPPTVSVIESRPARDGPRAGDRRLARAGHFARRATGSTWAEARARRYSNSLRQRRAEGDAHILWWCQQASPRTQDFIGDVALSPDGRLIYAADLYRDRWWSSTRSRAW